MRGLTGDDCTYMYNCFFWVLCIIVLVVAKCAANAVAQICKVLSCPSKCILICGCKYIGKGLHLISRMWTLPVLCQVR